RFRLGEAQESVAQGLGDALVQDPAAAFQETLISRVLHQRVLEGVGRRGRFARAEHQFGLVQSRERAYQRGLVAPCHGVEQAVREFAPDRSADLRDLLDRRETIETRYQRVLKGRGNREWR